MVLITGGNGAVGRRLALALARKGRPVRIFGLPIPSADAALRAEGVEVAHGDITQSEEIRAAMPGVETVFHLAAILSSPENPGRFCRVNAEGTRKVLAAAVSANARHFIFISSISVLYPRRNSYSASKAEAEEIVRAAAIPWTIARPCLVIGGAEYEAFAAAARRGYAPFLPRGGAARKRPIRVEDLAEALARMEGNIRCHGKTYSLGGAETVSLREMAAVISGRKDGNMPKLPVPEWMLRGAAVTVETASCLSGRRLSWLCGQSVDGLVFDADPESDSAHADLNFSPRGFREAVP